ncbi:ricin-type beta-trefoil lectin domain protein [Streptomyces sp. NPDC050535]|uniref:ricin-type beta-trefoil lectin domain protein n=1 Tax=Streptomyces sp. NPDC050535 TaxID=3365626 RepID=UPI0037B37DAC
MSELPERDVTGHLGSQPLGPGRSNDASEQRLAGAGLPRSPEEPADGLSPAASPRWAFSGRRNWILAAAVGAAVGVIVAGVARTTGGGPDSSSSRAEAPAEGLPGSDSGDSGVGSQSPRPGVPDAALVTPPSAVPTSSPGNNAQDSPRPSEAAASAKSGASPTSDGSGPGGGDDSGSASGNGVALVVEAAGKCLTGSGPGSELVASACDGSAGQSWSPGAAGSLRQGGLCATVTGAEDRTPVVLSTCDQSSAQRIALSGKALVSGPDSKCLDLFGGASGTRVVLWECNGRDNQRWSAA